MENKRDDFNGFFLCFCILFNLPFFVSTTYGLDPISNVSIQDDQVFMLKIKINKKSEKWAVIDAHGLMHEKEILIDKDCVFLVTELTYRPFLNKDNVFEDIMQIAVTHYDTIEDYDSDIQEVPDLVGGSNIPPERDTELSLHAPFQNVRKIQSHDAETKSHVTHLVNFPNDISNAKEYKTRFVNTNVMFMDYPAKKSSMVDDVLIPTVEERIRLHTLYKKTSLYTSRENIMPKELPITDRAVDFYYKIKILNSSFIKSLNKLTPNNTIENIDFIKAEGPSYIPDVKKARESTNDVDIWIHPR
jgi:hypothetical protein